MASSLSAIAASTSCGVFTLGMLVPWANSKGALCGAIAGAIMSGLVSYGGQFVSAAKLVVAHRLPVAFNNTCFTKYDVNNTVQPEVSIAIFYVIEGFVFINNTNKHTLDQIKLVHQYNSYSQYWINISLHKYAN